MSQTLGPPQSTRPSCSRRRARHGDSSNEKDSPNTIVQTPQPVIKSFFNKKYI